MNELFFSEMLFRTFLNTHVYIRDLFYIKDKGMGDGSFSTLNITLNLTDRLIILPALNAPDQCNLYCNKLYSKLRIFQKIFDRFSALDSQKNSFA